MVDGDLLLLITEKELESDIGIGSGLLRKRFMRELESLKVCKQFTTKNQCHLSFSDQVTTFVQIAIFIYLFQIAADYGSVDETQLDQFLMSLSPELSVYTYQMLGMGLNRNLLPSLTDEMMNSVCGMNNPIHRLKLRQALQGTGTFVNFSK